MFSKLNALLAPEDEGGAGGGAPAGDSPEGGSKKPDGEFVPKTQFLAALKSAEEKRERETATLRAELEELKKARPDEKPKRLSRAELLAAVTAQQITQEQADAEWERQIREDAKADAARVAREAVTVAQRTENVGQAIARYKRAEPEILVDGSEVREKIAAEFMYLVSLGDPQTVTTELKAIRAVCGPIEAFEKAKAGKSSHEPHQETGGSAGAPKKGGEFKDNLTAAQRAHYEQGIRAGRYKDWKEVEAELKYARAPVRVRA